MTEESDRALTTLVGQRGVQLHSMGEAMDLAKVIVSSGIAPAGIQTAEQAFVAMQTGMELGFTPIRSLSAVVVVKGKPTLMGEAALGLIRASGQLEPGTDIEVGCRKVGDGDDGIEGYCRSHRRGGKLQETVFTLADAKRAKLYPPQKDESPWQKYTKRMLMWRAASFHCRDYWSDVTMGLRFADEARDMAEADRIVERDVTPRDAGTFVTGPEKDPLLAGSDKVVEWEILEQEPSQEV